MNILLINHYAGSTEMGMEFRPYYFAEEWTKMGHKVHILAADYSHLRTKNPVVRKDFQREVTDGIIYHWIRTGQYDGNGVKRALTMFRFVGKIWLHARQIAKAWKPDVVITSSTYPLDTFAGQKIAGYCGARLIHEVHDMWPATLIELGGMSRMHPFVLLMQAAENSAYRRSDFIVSLLSLAKGYMVRHGMKAEKFVHIANGIVPKDWESPEKLPDEHVKTLNKLKEDGSFIIGYFGGHARSNALDVLLDTAKKISDSNIQFVLAGSGVEKKRLIARVRKEGIKNVHFLPPVAKKAVPELVSYYDCSFLCSADSTLYRFGICMNKIYDSMMAGIPIFCAVRTPDPIIEKYQCGIMERSSDAGKLAASIERFYRLPQEDRKRMGENGKRAAAAFFTYEILAQKFALLFTGRKGES